MNPLGYIKLNKRRGLEDIKKMVAENDWNNGVEDTGYTSVDILTKEDWNVTEYLTPSGGLIKISNNDEWWKLKPMPKDDISSFNGFMIILWHLLILVGWSIWLAEFISHY
jgi:hypothetical protein